jgi:Zn-dependent protease with chaperone function
MDFFERQDQSRRNTRRLVLLFAAGLVVLMVAVYLASLLFFISIASPRHRHGHSERQLAQLGLWHPKVFLWSCCGTLVVVAGGALSKMQELSSGGSAVAEMLGGRLVLPGTINPDERRLLNVVEEMSIASGVPVPQVYVLPAEKGINAFAAGYSTSDAAVAVTQGAIQRLNRDELQGVIAHEFSHILNGDMRLNIRLISLVFGIMSLAIIGRILLETRGSSRRGKNPLPLFGLALLLIGWIGGLFGRLLQCAVSRQREVLADAAAVQFTRNPAGLAGALKKIGALSYRSRVQAAHASETAHLFFSNAAGSQLFSTHPPLAERIRALDPQFDGKFPKASETYVPEFAEESSGLRQAAYAPGQTLAKAPAPPFISRTASPANLVGSVGTLNLSQVRYANELRSSIPEDLRTAARDPLTASCIVYALLLSPDNDQRTIQLRELGTIQDNSVVEETLRVLPAVMEVCVGARLPLLDLVIPTLKLMSEGQFDLFSASIDRLVECDQQVDMLEYVLRTVVERHVAPKFRGAERRVIQYYTIKPLVSDCAVLLSALAHCGAGEVGAARGAFNRGLRVIMQYAQVNVPFPGDINERGLTQIDAALQRLSQAAPQIKKNVLLACAHTVAADGVLHELEAELLRAIADTLDCPLPPAMPAC